MDHLPTKDFSGNVLAELPTREIERRLENHRRNPDGHPTSRRYERAYRRILEERKSGVVTDGR